MGGRLSMPRSPDGMTEISKPTTPRRTINARTLTAPLAAITMASLLFVYARTSIQAAKLNAQKHREADGGQISWHKESLRRHGAIEKVDETGNLKEALLANIGRGKGKEKVAEEVERDLASGQKGDRYSDGEKELREILGKDKKKEKR